ncbi:Hypothetical predicted protein [Lynx pardinus]|uniref:Uncharacterized protein n=1 Tax=Lynx pardinus TaxID=191816 RepID=A0A485MR81_LYNPA|nr:Hypothetical predicted protein [Lynx pardinus]
MPREQVRPPRGPDRHGHGMARSPASPGQPQTPSFHTASQRPASTRPPNGSCQPTDVPRQEHTSPFPALPGDTGVPGAPERCSATWATTKAGT